MMVFGSYGQTNKTSSPQMADSTANGSSIMNNMSGRDSIPGQDYPGTLQNTNSGTAPGVNQNAPVFSPNSPAGVTPILPSNNQNNLNSPGFNQNQNLPGINNNPGLNNNPGINSTPGLTPGTPGINTPGLPNAPSTPGIPNSPASTSPSVTP